MNKKITPFLLLLLFINIGNAQENSSKSDFIKIPLQGISPEIEQAILPYDFIKKLTVRIDTISIYKNIETTHKITTTSSFKKAKYDSITRHYDTKYVKLSVATKKNFLSKLNKPVFFTVTAETAFGNYIWTKVERNASNITDPITLDKYSSIPENIEEKASYNINIRTTLFKSSIEKKLIEGDELIRNDNGIPIIIKLKNVSQTNYMSQMIVSDNKRWAAYTKMPLGSNIDPAKPIELLMSIPTKYGNYIWKKRLINKEFSIYNIDFSSTCIYSRKEGNKDAPLSYKVKKTTNNQPEKTVDSQEPQILKEAITKENDNNTTPKTNKKYTLKQHKGIIEIATVPNDTIKGNIKSTLLKDANITVGGQSVYLKGNTPIMFNAGKKYIVTATASKDQTIKTNYGPITIKGDEPIRFSPYRITGFNLKGNTTINTNYGQFKAKAKHKVNDFDITMTDSGKLTGFTLAEAKTTEVGEHSFTIPEESTIKMSNDAIQNINLSKETPYNIAGLNVMITTGNSKKPSISFLTKNATISRLYVSKSSDINTPDGALKVDSNSLIYFENNGTEYIINRFQIGETKDIKTYKKNGKVKVKTAKKGKDIILVGGQVRRISW